VPTLVQEEAPATPQRIGLIIASLLVSAAEIFLIWQFSAMLVLPALVVINGLLLLITWRFAQGQMHRLTRAD
jgi:hypothetical protein